MIKLYWIQLKGSENKIYTNHQPTFDHPIRDCLNIWFGFKNVMIDMDLIEMIAYTKGDGWIKLWKKEPSQ